MPEQQRMTALKRANEIRCTRAADKKAIFNGSLSVQTVLLANPSEWASASVLELLTAAKRVGEVRARKVCLRAAISPAKPLGELTDRQREFLCHVFTERVG